MKNQKRKSSILSIAAVALCSGVIALTACKKDEVQTPSPAVKSDSQMHSKFDSNTIEKLLSNDALERVLSESAKIVEEQANKLTGEVVEEINEVFTETISYEVNVTQNSGELLMSLAERVRWLAEILVDANQIKLNPDVMIYAIDVELEAQNVMEGKANVNVHFLHYNKGDVGKFKTNCSPFPSSQGFYADEMAKMIKSRYVKCNDRFITDVPKIPGTKHKVWYWSEIESRRYAPLNSNCTGSNYSTKLWSHLRDQLFMSGSRWEVYYEKFDEVAEDFMNSTSRTIDGHDVLININYVNQEPNTLVTCSHVFHSPHFATGKMKVKNRELIDLLGLD